MSEIMEPLLTTALRERTKEIHGTLDDYLMGLGLFADKEKYIKFLTIQYYIHSDVAHLYGNTQLATLIPNLHQRNRFENVVQDMQDLNVAIPQPTSTAPSKNLSAAVGELYVVEGSKLGAKYLSHFVSKIGMTDQFGARHLAADQEGRGPSWRAFQNAVNTANIDIPVALDAAEQAFRRVFSHAKYVMEQ